MPRRRHDVQDPEEAPRALARRVLEVPDGTVLGAARRKKLERALADVRERIAQHGANDAALVVELAALGKLGRTDEAVDRARRALAERPSWSTAIGVGNALRRAGDTAGAIEAFREAARLAPEDTSALLEVGDLHLAAGAVREALAAYEDALARKEGQPWAEVSAWYCRYRLDGDERWLERLREAANEPDDECGVAAILAGLTGAPPPGERKQRAAWLLEEHEG